MKKKKTGKLITRRLEFKRQASVFMTSFFVTLAVLGLIFGIFMVDKNTKEIGWGTENTTLAFSSSTQKLGMTVLGKNCSVSLGQKERRILQDASIAVSDMAPCRDKLLEMAFSSAGKYLSTHGFFE